MDLKQVRKMVKSEPANTSARFILFEFLLEGEDFPAAENELQQFQAFDSTADVRQLLAWLAAARERHHFLTGGAKETSSVAQMGWASERPPYIDAFGQAISAANRKKGPDATSWLQQGWAQVSLKSGSIDGTRFLGLRDADDFIGPFLEVLLTGEYAWIPFENIQSIRFAEQESYLDAIWVPAQIEAENFSGEVRIPALYAGSGSQREDVKRGRRTVFRKVRKNPVRAYGQREFQFTLPDASEPGFKAIREVREIAFD